MLRFTTPGQQLRIHGILLFFIYSMWSCTILPFFSAYSPLPVADGQVYIGLLGTNEQKQYFMYKRLALDAATSIIRWQIPESADIGDLRTIDGQSIYAGSGDTLFAYKTTDGSKLWRYTCSSIPSNNHPRITDIVVIPSAS